MRNTILTACLLFSALAYGQKSPVLEGDTLSYLDKKYAIGDTLTLGYGSAADKSFAFVTIGSAFIGKTKLESKWSKSPMLVNKITKERGKYSLRCKPIAAGFIGDNKVFIDLEGAIDNKELLEK